MKPRLLALAVVAFVSLADDVWVWVAYRTTEVQGITIYDKRAAFLPGKDRMVPPQKCYMCEFYQSHSHSCYGGKPVEVQGNRVAWIVRGGEGLPPFRCTCNHPSHAEKKP